MSRSNREQREPRSYGAPMGAPKPRDPSSTPKPRAASTEERRRQIERQVEEGRRAAPPPPPAEKPPPPTSDLSAAGAGRRVSGRQRQIDRAVEEALK